MEFFRRFQKIAKRPSESHFLAIDIGTDNVKAVICEAEGKRGNIVGYGVCAQKLGDMQSGAITDINAVIRNCHQAIKQAENQAGIYTQKMILGVSGELVKGCTHTTSYMRRDANTKIDLAELKDIVHKIQWRSFDIIRNKLANETGYNEIDIRLINAAIVDMNIDGYRVSNPIGFQGKEISLSIYNAFSPLMHFGALQTIAAEIDRDLIAVASEPYALARSMINEDRSQFSGIFIDVGGGTTDIVVVLDGVILGSNMFTIGGRTFTKRLSQSLNISFYDAEKIKLSYSNDKLERQSHRIVREAMKHDLDVWLSGVVLTLEEFDTKTELPSRIFLSGRASHLPEIKEALETREWMKSLPFTKKPQVSFINSKMIHRLSDPEKVLKEESEIMPLALARLGLDYLGEEILPAKVLKKVVRLMQI